MSRFDDSMRVEAALSRYLSFRSFAKKVSKPETSSLILGKDWKPFYLKNLNPTASVRLGSGENVDVLNLKNQFAESRFSVYRKLVSNFYDSDCGCEGT
jgi:hypothetical protein